MSLLPLSIGLSAAQTIPNWIAAFEQSSQAKKLEAKTQRPDFIIPGTEQEALDSAKNVASMTRMPGMSAIEGQIDQNTSNTLDTIERFGAGGPSSINAAGMAYANQNDAISKLGINAAQSWMGNQGALRNELHNMSEWKQKEWAWDKADPYIQSMDAIRALKEGSMRNFDSAFKDVFGGASNIALSAYMVDNNNKMLKSLLEGLNGPETVSKQTQGSNDNQTVASGNGSDVESFSNMSMMSLPGGWTFGMDPNKVQFRPPVSVNEKLYKIN